MDRYVYINLTRGDNDKDMPAIIRFKAVDFGNGVDSKIFDKSCKPIRPLERFVEKFLGIGNKELENYPQQNEVRQELLRFIDGAHVICDDIGLCEKVLDIKLNDIRTTADVRRANGVGYFDERYRDVLKQAQEGELTLADIQRKAQCGFSEACIIADDLVFHDFLIKTDSTYILNETQAQKFTKGDKPF